jgi:hypothetical protein
MQKINIKGMAQTIVDIVLLQNQEEIKKNQFGVQYPNDILGTLNKVVGKCKSNSRLEKHENRLIEWHEELKKIKKVSKDPQEIIDYFRKKHTEARNIPITFDIKEIKNKYPHFSEKDIATIIVFQEEWDQFLEGINESNKSRKEKNNWQRILAPISFFGGAAMSTAGVMLYLHEPAAAGYSVDVAKPVDPKVATDSTAVTDPKAVQSTTTDIPTGSSNVGRGGSSEAPMQQNNIGYNSNGTPDTTGASGTGTTPDASNGASVNASGGHELTDNQQLGIALLIIGIIIALTITAICIYSEIDKQSENENLPPVTPLKAPQDLEDEIKQLAGTNESKINNLAKSAKSNIDINNLRVDDDQNISDIDSDDNCSVHSTRGKGITSKLGLI